MPSDNPGVDTDSFQEWLAQTAASNDTSEEEVFNQMMSSYWILNELTDFIDQPDLQEAAVDDAATTEGMRESVVDEAGESSDQANSSKDAVPSNTGTKTVDTSLIELLKILNQTDISPSQSRAAGDPVALINALSDFGQSPSDNAGHETQELAAIKDEIEELRSEVDSVHDEVEHLTDDVDNLNGRLDDVDQRHTRQIEAVDERHAAQIDDLTAAVNNLKGEIEDLHTKAEQKARAEDVDENFEKVKSILEHQLDRIDDIDNETTILFDSYDDLRPLLANLDERKQAAELKTAANREGTDTATCESCDNSVSIHLLERPVCPHCEHWFDDLKVDSGWLRTSYTLTTSKQDTTRNRLAGTGDGESVLPTLDES